MGKKLPNFYENLQEAQMRLRSTIVLYEKVPYSVFAITDHKGDGKFRIYLDPMNYDREQPRARQGPDVSMYHPQAAEVGIAIDAWMEKNKEAGFLRKQMDSPHFNRFRPFPLGMCNQGISCFYLERQPQRNREQGLTRAMVTEARIGAADGMPKHSGMNHVDMWSQPFRDTIVGKYPSVDEVIRNLKDPEVENNAVGFHRKFAIIRGPLDMLFLGYKDFVVGVLPKADLSEVILSRKFPQYKEVIEELSVFGKVTQQ